MSYPFTSYEQINRGDAVWHRRYGTGFVLGTGRQLLDAGHYVDFANVEFFDGPTPRTVAVVDLYPSNEENHRA